MTKKIIIFALIIMLMIIVLSPVYSDVRTENIELYILLDKSKSMVEEISDVTDYINSYFINDFLITGDRLVLLQFYGKTDLVYDQIINDQNIENIRKNIADIPADGRFTDIGNALDQLDRTVSSGVQRHERQYFILMTDGKQEAPEESPYYSPDGSFNHEFLKNTKTIQKKGWKILIIGIGKDTVVEELADELLTTYKEVEFADELNNLEDPKELLGRIISEKLEIHGNIIELILRSEGYVGKREVSIKQILFQQPGGNYELLEESLNFFIEEYETKTVEIEIENEKLVNIPSGIPGSLLFQFSGNTPFIPAVFESVEFDVAAEGKATNDDEENLESSPKNMNKSFNWLIIVIVIIAAAAITAFILIRNSVKHRDEDEENNETGRKISDDS